MITMKSGTQPFVVVVLTLVLAMGALACPLWMTSVSQADAHCSRENDSPRQCPMSVCQVSSEYLIDGPNTNVLPTLRESRVGVGHPKPVPLAFGAIASEPFCSGYSPGLHGPLFLRIHSLLI